MSLPTSADRLLVRHFLCRFMENDLASPSADRRRVASLSLGILIGTSLFAAVWSSQALVES